MNYEQLADQLTMIWSVSLLKPYFTDNTTNTKHLQTLTHARVDSIVFKWDAAHNVHTNNSK
jgi:hypothetical protein